MAIPNVAAGELIESAWGNAVGDQIDANTAQIAAHTARLAQIMGDVAVVTTDTNGGAGFNTPSPPAGSIGFTLSTTNPALMDVVVILYAVSGTLVSFVARHASDGTPVASAGVTVHWQVV